MTVDEPADQDRVEGAEHGRERESPRRSRARPAEFGGQRPEEHAEGVEDGADVQAVRDEADRDDPPAVKDARRGAGRGQQAEFLDSECGLWDERRLMPRPDYPVLVGFGQTTQRGDDPRSALEPVALAAQAARRAEADCGASILSRVDSVRMVNVISWDYGDAPGALATMLGLEPRETAYTTMGGNSPQYLINSTADDIASGKVRVALLAGVEAMYTQRLARARKLKLAWRSASGRPDRTIGDDRWGSQEEEQRHGAAMPIQVYPLLENALRAANGLRIEEQRVRLGRQCARFSEIAAQNPYSWFAERKSAEEISTVTRENRMIGFPYPK